MATSKKRLTWWFPELASVTDNTDTNFTQQTIYMPESSKVFSSVFLECLIQDAEATSNNINRRQLSIQLGSAGYSATNNTNLMTSSAEQKWIGFRADVTSYFTTNWSGSSMTCDVRVLCDNAIASPSQNWRCATVRLVINYEYDDTSATQIKTIKYPLNAPVGNLPTTKQGTATATIPAFDTELPEASKTIRQIALVVQGNEERAATTDYTMSWEIDTLGVYTTGSHEGALNTACWYRHVQLQTFTTNATHNFFLWASSAFSAHPQAWLEITYEYNEASTTTVWNSVELPFFFDGGGGATTSSDYNRASIEFWIEEPTTITTKPSSAMFFWNQQDAITGMVFRCNSGSFSSALTSTATTVAGNCGAMFRCEGDITLARGKNTITLDAYNTDSTDFQAGLSGYLILNYTSGKSTRGTGAHNRTIEELIIDVGTAAANRRFTATRAFLSIPETNYFINNAGAYSIYTGNSTVFPAGAYLLVERLSGEGGVQWHSLIKEIAPSDSLLGNRYLYGVNPYLFNRWNDDSDTTRLPIETSRRFYVTMMVSSATAGWMAMFNLVTYHALSFTVSGNVTGSSGGTVNIDLHRTATGEKVKSTSRSGNGTYTFTWMDNTENVYAVARESGTLLGRSDNGLATGSP